MDHSENGDELLERIRQGDAGAQEELLRLVRPRLVQIVRARMDPRLRGRVDPSDVVQETLADAHKHLDDYLRDRPLPLVLWLRKLACNHLVDLHRQHVLAQKRSVLREARHKFGSLSEEAAGELSDLLIADNTSPSLAARREELRLRLLTALQEMSEKDREVLTLRHLEGLTVLEIAAVLGVTESAVKVRHFRALNRIRLALGEASHD